MDLSYVDVLFKQESENFYSEILIQATMCKMNADEIQSWFQPKNCQTFEQNFMTCQLKFQQNFGEPHKNLSTSQKCAESRAKFQSIFICTEVKFLKATRKF